MNIILLCKFETPEPFCVEGRLTFAFDWKRKTLTYENLRKRNKNVNYVKWIAIVLKNLAYPSPNGTKVTADHFFFVHNRRLDRNLDTSNNNFGAKTNFLHKICLISLWTPAWNQTGVSFFKMKEETFWKFQTEKCIVIFLIVFNENILCQSYVIFW